MRFAIGMALVLSLPALAAAREPVFQSLVGKIVRARCHMDVCTWFSIESSDLAGQNRDGLLLHVVIKDWSSTHPDGSYDILTDRKYVSTSDDYFLCSKNNPAVIYKSPESGDWLGYRLWPDHAERIFGANEGVYIRYYAACHAVAVADPYEAAKGLASTLGYRTKPTESDREEKLASPEAALLW